MSVTSRRTVFSFVWLDSFARLQRSESINDVFYLTTLMAPMITLAHTVFIHTTHVVISFIFQKEESQKFLFLASGSNADCIVTIVTTAQSVTQSDNISRRIENLYFSTVCTLFDASLWDLFVFAREISTCCMGPMFSTETLWQTPHHHQTASTVNNHLQTYI